MKIKSAVKRLCEHCYMVRRGKTLYVRCTKNPRHKQRQGFCDDAAAARRSRPRLALAADARRPGRGIRRPCGARRPRGAPLPPGDDLRRKGPRTGISAAARVDRGVRGGRRRLERGSSSCSMRGPGARSRRSRVREGRALLPRSVNRSSGSNRWRKSAAIVPAAAAP